MFKISVKTVGTMVHASTQMGHVIGMGPTPVAAVKHIADAMQDVFPRNFVMASNTGHGFLIEKIDHLMFKDHPLWWYKIMPR